MQEASFLGGERRVDRARQLVSQLADLVFGDDERRGEQNVIAMLAVDRAARGIADQPFGERGLLDLGVKLQLRVEGRFRAAIRDKLDPRKRPLPLMSPTCGCWPKVACNRSVNAWPRCLT